MIPILADNADDTCVCVRRVDGLRVAVYQRDAKSEHTVYHAEIEYPDHSVEAAAAARRFHLAMRDVLARRIRRSNMDNPPDRFIYALENEVRGDNIVAEFPFVIPSDMSEQERFIPNLIGSAASAYDQIKAQSHDR